MAPLVAPLAAIQSLRQFIKSNKDESIKKEAPSTIQQSDAQSIANQSELRQGKSEEGGESYSVIAAADEQLRKEESIHLATNKEAVTQQLIDSTELQQQSVLSQSQSPDLTTAKGDLPIEQSTAAEPITVQEIHHEEDEDESSSHSK